MRCLELAAVADEEVGKVPSSLQQQMDGMSKVVTELVASVQGLETERDREDAAKRAKAAEKAKHAKPKTHREAEVMRLQQLLQQSELPTEYVSADELYAFETISERVHQLADGSKLELIADCRRRTCAQTR